MIGQSLVAREAEILRVLNVLHEARVKFTLIGGYAVDAYSPRPRYSVDCDIVIPKEQLDNLLSLLSEQGYRKGEVYHNELEGVETRRLSKRVGEEEVFVDLLVGGVRCRQTTAVWKEEEVRMASKELRVVGVNGSVLSNVAAKEMLIAMKLHSGRDPDLRDIVMLESRTDWRMVGGLSRRGSKEKVVHQLQIVVDVLSDKEFEGRLKAYFGLKQGARRRIGSVLNRVNQLLQSVEREKKPWTDARQLPKATVS
jgi:predicted nucleotidyltransferase